MQTIAVVVGLALVVGANIAYPWYASTRSQGLPIPFFFLRLTFVPWGIDLVYYAIMGVGAVLILLPSRLPLGVAAFVYVAAVLLPWELMRRRHNHQVCGKH
ncbi:hypothetical protein [Nonomuraea africana]|uniref:DUF2834 domain-containing protein n=1 Tax=Nonomuraea africana TaxID=46171 RepID=A0ABR9KVX3_9ACTN|nr:hypothetical protein [Nonomuraea africana]MBE1566183.1 hypothetical protein [Nonomuraea africana]